MVLEVKSTFSTNHDKAASSGFIFCNNKSVSIETFAMIDSF